MVNVRTPAQHLQVHRKGKWPPDKFREAYTVLDSDNWWTVAEKFQVDVWALIEFNFDTRIPEEVNWYLRELVGCRMSNDGKNYSFRGADPTKRKIYIPLPNTPIPNTPPQPNIGYKRKTYEEALAEIKMQVEAGHDPRKRRFQCIISKLESGADDRVIVWNKIAPDDRTPVPLNIVKRRMGRGVISPEWMYEKIKSWTDVEGMRAATYLSSDTIVTSLKKELDDANFFQFQAIHDDIIRTHDTLEKWANVAIGGSSSMPREYRAIKEWVRRQTTKPNTVLNCVTSSGRRP